MTPENSAITEADLSFSSVNCARRENVKNEGAESRDSAGSIS